VERSLKVIIGEYFKEGTEAFLSHVSINNVVFGYDHPCLKVLVQRISGYDFWMLPGGFIKYKENLDDAVYRNLKMSGIEDVFLRQIGTFGDAFRITGNHDIKADTDSRFTEVMRWASRRFVTVAYYGLVKYHQTKIVSGALSSECAWIDVNKLEKMGVDHATIVSATRKMLVTELQNYPVASRLLPDTFTLNELRGLYESILNRNIDRGTFRRKILSQGIVEKVDIRKDIKGRPSDIFRFNQEIYLQSLKEEAKFGF
jgi:8-oxo-dGTP diphosphatase